MPDLLDRVRSGVGARGGVGAGAWSTASEVSKLVSSTVLFVLVARRLGVAEYGVFAAASSLVATVNCVCNLGAGHVLMRSVAQGTATHRGAFKVGWTMLLCGGSAGAVIAAVLGHSLLPGASIVVMLLLGVADMIGTTSTDLVAQLHFARGAAVDAARVRFTVAVGRIAAASTLFVVPLGRSSILEWAALYCTAMAVTLVVVLGGAHRQGHIEIAVGLDSFRQLFIGLPFCLNLSAAYVQDDIDKTMVLHYAGDTTGGFYAAGYRAVNFAYVPLQAALNVFYPRFFAAGKEGVSATAALVRKLVRPALLYGVASCLGLCAVAPFVPSFLGAGFGRATDVAMLASWLPLVRALDYCFADFLTGLGRQRQRTALQVVGAASNVLLNLWLIPRYSWRGALVSTAVSELLTLSLLAVSFAVVVRRAGALPPEGERAPASSGQARSS